MIKEDEEEREKFIRGRERDEKKSIIRKIKKKRHDVMARGRENKEKIRKSKRKTKKESTARIITTR